MLFLPMISGTYAINIPFGTGYAIIINRPAVRRIPVSKTTHWVNEDTVCQIGHESKEQHVLSEKEQKMENHVKAETLETLENDYSQVNHASASLLDDWRIFGQSYSVLQNETDGIKQDMGAALDRIYPVSKEKEKVMRDGSAASFLDANWTDIKAWMTAESID